MDPDADPGGPKTYRSYGSGCESGSATLDVKKGGYLQSVREERPARVVMGISIL
jgi:hypothetical protein